MALAGGTLDALFAGMPRSSVWPPDPAEPGPVGRDACSATTAATAPGRRRGLRGTTPRGPPDGRCRSAAGHGRRRSRRPADGPGGSRPVGRADAGARPRRSPGPAARSAPRCSRPDARRSRRASPTAAAALLGVAMRIGPHLAPSSRSMPTIDADAPALTWPRPRRRPATRPATTPRPPDAYAAARGRPRRGPEPGVAASGLRSATRAGAGRRTPEA